MTMITLNLPEALAQRAGRVAEAMQRPLEDIMTAMLDAVLPTLDDVPSHLQAELVEMTWLDDNALLVIADAAMPQSDQQRLLELGARDVLTSAEREEIEALRALYGRLTLRKARALALLSVRSGKRLLGDIAKAA